jgi:hypothetical protein
MEGENTLIRLTKGFRYLEHGLDTLVLLLDRASRSVRCKLDGTYYFNHALARRG